MSGFFAATSGPRGVKSSGATRGHTRTATQRRFSFFRENELGARPPTLSKVIPTTLLPFLIRRRVRRLRHPPPETPRRCCRRRVAPAAMHRRCRYVLSPPVRQLYDFRVNRALGARQAQTENAETGRARSASSAGATARSALRPSSSSTTSTFFLPPMPPRSFKALM